MLGAVGSTRRRSACRRTGCVAAAPSAAYEAQYSSGSSTARNASHGRLTTGRSHLSRCPDRADDQRASDCFRRGTLSILTCVVLGSCLHIVGFRPVSVRHTSATLYLNLAHHSIRDTLSRKGERMCVEARNVELCSQMVHGTRVDFREPGTAGFPCTSPRIMRQHIARGP